MCYEVICWPCAEGQRSIHNLLNLGEFIQIGESRGGVSKWVQKSDIGPIYDGLCLLDPAQESLLYWNFVIMVLAVFFISFVVS